MLDWFSTEKGIEFHCFIGGGTGFILCCLITKPKVDIPKELRSILLLVGIMGYSLLAW